MVVSDTGHRYNCPRKEAGGICLLSAVNGVQVVGGSNPLTPIFGLCEVAAISQNPVDSLRSPLLKTSHRMCVQIQRHRDAAVAQSFLNYSWVFSHHQQGRRVNVPQSVQRHPHTSIRGLLVVR